MVKKYIEPEIIKDEIEDKYEKAKEFGEDKFEEFEDTINGFKRGLILKGLASLIVPITIFFIFLIGIITLIFIIFNRPFNYIISGIILFFVFKFFYHIIKLIK